MPPGRCFFTVNQYFRIFRLIPLYFANKVIRTSFLQKVHILLKMSYRSEKDV